MKITTISTINENYEQCAFDYTKYNGNLND